MSRILKPENFVIFSASRKQVSEMRGAECLPLVMEPITKFYESPLVVLDFQSLYPSVMIAYNYWWVSALICLAHVHSYSTCLGKVADFGNEHQLGVNQHYKVDLQEVSDISDKLIGSPFSPLFNVY